MYLLSTPTQKNTELTPRHKFHSPGDLIQDEDKTYPHQKFQTIQDVSYTGINILRIPPIYYFWAIFKLFKKTNNITLYKLLSVLRTLSVIGLAA